MYNTEETNIICTDADAPYLRTHLRKSSFSHPPGVDGGVDIRIRVPPVDTPFRGVRPGANAAAAETRDANKRSFMIIDVLC